MRCLQARRWLSMYHDGHPAGREAAGVAAHLRGCAACRLLGEQMVSLENEVRAAVPAEWGAPSRFSHRVIDRWMAERAAGHRIGRWPRFPLSSLPVAYSCVLAASVGAALLIAGSLSWQQSARSRGQGQQVAGAFEGRQHASATHPVSRASERRYPRHGLSRPASLSGTVLHGVPQPLPHDSPHAPSAVQRRPPSRAGDLAYWNADPENAAPRWASLTEDERDTIERRVRQAIRTKEDFVTIPFPRLASTSDRQVASAVASYKREAAIVDPRLSREVECVFKGAALSDVCNQLRGDAGIELTAGPSVADEKVTVFCEKMPLREVMRQLSRPFGYTWLRSKKEGGDYRYELVQDLRSQLLEEELRNRDRDAALLDLEKEIDRYRPYLSLSPDEALARSRTAAPEEKKLLENLAGWGWGPLQLYARLSPQQQAALRAGQTITFSGDPHRVARDGCEPLPPELERGVLQSMRDVRVRRPGGHTSSGNPFIEPDGVPPAASPEANGFVSLRIGHSELGQFTFDGGSGVTVGNSITVRGHDGDLGRGVSPADQNPMNEVANARLAHDPALQGRVTVEAGVRGPGSGVSPAGSPPPQPRIQTFHPEDTRHPKPKVTTADVLEALHRASGLPIVADFYTHLYRQESVSTTGQSLFEALNHLADTMHLRWSKDGDWLQFRSVSFYDDRVKEVPNRLLARWAAARREHDGLPLDDLIEMAQLSDAQLDSRFVGEGVRELWGLEEWSLAQNHEGRPHLRYLAQFTAAQRQMAMSAQGLAFSQLSLNQQQGLIAHLGDRLQSLGELAGATVRVEYSEPGGFRWPAINWQPPSGQPNLFGLAQVREPTRAAALAAARRLDAGVSEAQIAPTDLSLTVVYTLIDPRTGKARELGVRPHADGALISW